MSESTNSPAGERTGIGEAVTTALRQPAFLRVMLGLAATVVVLVGIRLGAPILNPILFAVVLSLLFSPVYAWVATVSPQYFAEHMQPGSPDSPVIRESQRYFSNHS
jgi:hypothetical protein